MNLLNDVKISRVKAASAAGVTAVNSDGVDMQGFEEVTFLLAAQGITSGGVQSISLSQSDDDGSTDAYSALLGTGITIADDDDNQTFALSVKNPQKRWVRLEIARATQNSAFSEIFALRTGAKQTPVDNNGANTITSEAHNCPAEGAA